MRKSGNSAMRDHSAEAALFSSRAIICLCFAAGLFCVLMANMYNLQINQFDDYATRSDENRIKVLPIRPPRGLIYDRNGILLAENQPTFDLEVIPEQVKNLNETVKELSALLDIQDSERENFFEEQKHSRHFKPIVLMSNLDDRQVALFSVNQHKYPGVSIESKLIRYYPYGAALTHVVGYVARINNRDVEELTDDDQIANYRGTSSIGKLGIERYYEETLHGEAGYQEVEVNNRGRVIRTMKVVPPTPGKDLYLNIDVNLQLQALSLLNGRRGSVVLLDAKDSGILALVTSPSYDPNPFVSGISSKDYQLLQQSPDSPFLNRATQGAYSPASTVKPMLAVMGLDLGKINETDTMFDPGWFQIPNTKRVFRDWKRWGHGNVDVYKAIEQSVDTYFYKLAYDAGIDNIYTYMSRFGFGQPSGIDIDEERTANLPSREWKKRVHKQPWWQGDTISVGIGQGYWTATPIQLAQAVNILANRGQIRIPKLLRSISSPTEQVDVPVIEKPPIVVGNPLHWQVALDGMHGVVEKRNGTAHKAFLGTTYSAAGKSGTAQVVNIAEDAEYDAEKLTERHRDNAMFVAIAPFDKPEIVATVVIENAGGGSSNAAPLIRRLFDGYFSNKWNPYQP
jgi:penicillin-binding protein 2